VKQKFYIDSTDDAERCGESLRCGNPICIKGEDPFTGRLKPYKGIVVTVDRVTAEPSGERWWIAIETELAH